MATSSRAATISLSPGRQTSRTVTQSPAVGYRTMLPGAVTIARNTKSMSDLTHVMVAAGAVRGGSPPPRASPRVSSAVGRQPELAAAPVVIRCMPGPTTPRQSTRSNLNSQHPYVYQGCGPTSHSGSLPPNRNSLAPPASPGATGVIWPGAIRSSSADRKYLHWASTPTSAAGVPATTKQQSGPTLPAYSARQLSPSRQAAWAPGASAAAPSRPSSLAPRMQPHSSLSALAPAGPGVDSSSSMQVLVGPTRRAASMAVPAYSCLGMEVQADEVAKLKSTLMQQIQSVQKEIQRAEHERQERQNDRSSRRQVSQPSRISQVGQATPAAPAPQSTMTSQRAAAATRIQSYWRRQRLAGRSAAKDAPPQEAALDADAQTLNMMQSQSAPKPALNHAARRIQRAWKLSRWRRVFVAYCRRDLGWVGSLDWLQRHNMLYGTELAEQEDLDWWSQQQAGAPLDYEVDPWGCKKLRDHLNRMWYGYTPEEQQQEQRKARSSSQEEGALKEQHVSAGAAARDSSQLDAHRRKTGSVLQRAQLLQPQLSRDMQRQSTAPVSTSGVVHSVFTAGSPRTRMLSNGARSFAGPAGAPLTQAVNRSTTAVAFSPRLESRTMQSTSTVALHRCQSPTLVSRTSRVSSMVPISSNGSYAASPGIAPRLQGQSSQIPIRRSFQGSPRCCPSPSDRTGPSIAAANA